MQYVVLDTDVASRSIKRQLDGPLAAKLTGVAWCITFVTVGELWQWASARGWGRRTRDGLELWLDRVVVLHSDDAVSRAWGKISADARRGRHIPPVTLGFRHGAVPSRTISSGSLSRDPRPTCEVADV